MKILKQYYFVMVVAIENIFNIFTITFYTMIFLIKETILAEKYKKKIRNKYAEKVFAISYLTSKGEQKL